MEINDFKKGMTVYCYAPFNFYGFGGPRKPEYNTDDISIEKWIVHSAGKKVMRLMDETGKCKSREIYFAASYRPEKCFAETESECRAMALAEWESDPLKSPFVQITNRNLYF